jgi:cellulose synthase/poly-beta-1,6-N-acetylglucosamine synthase-like glycosyltransferase
MIFVFYFFAAVLVFMSWKSFRGGIDYLNFFKNELRKPKSDFTPFVSIIAPCRGLDEDLEENLSALFRQDFPEYEILFVVDDEADEAVKIIEKVSSSKSVPSAVAGGFSPQSKLIVAGKAYENAQKAHNLRRAVLEVSGKSKVFVFVDSDARPVANWLRDLIAPLRDENVGAASAYRWFISKKFSFASEMRSVWNASIASALGANQKTNFCWGGSMAIRRDTFEKLGIREKWRGVVSDDFAVTRAMKESGLPIRFVPQALTASIENCSFKELFEFTTRQMKITRVYAANLWIQSFIGSFVFNLVFVWGILILVFYYPPADAGGTDKAELPFWFALTSLMIVSVFSIGKAWLRLNAVKLVLKDHERELNRQFWTQNTLWILSPALFFYNAFCALLSRKITWRGIKYKLVSPDRTEIIAGK